MCNHLSRHTFLHSKVAAWAFQTMERLLIQKRFEIKRNAIIAEARVTQSIIHILPHLDFHLLMCGVLNAGGTILVISDILMCSADIAMAPEKLRRFVMRMYMNKL
ncbi:MAG: hypothetical protein IJ940_04240, partial [Bacteroidales bacterium]|nr:hypothetical protein [Bacteroidales bacterium]